MNRIVILISLFFGCHLLYAQVDLTDIGPKSPSEFPDTLVLETESKIELTFAFYKMRDKKEYINNELWSGILGTMETAVASSEYEEGIEVSYRKVQKNEEEQAKIEVTPLASPSDIFIIGKEGIKEKPADRIEFRLKLKYVVITFFVVDMNQLQELSDFNIESVWDQIELKYNDDGKRKIYYGNGVIKYDNANINTIDSNRIGNDAIELSMGVGMGFYRDRFIPDLGFLLGFNFPDRYGDSKIQTGLLYTQQYIFDSTSEIATVKPDINGFLSGFFKIRFANGNGLGWGVGYLLHSEGDFYQGDTFKFSFFAERDDSSFSFTPEMIFTNNFNQAFPALRIGLSF